MVNYVISYEVLDWSWCQNVFSFKQNLESGKKNIWFYILIYLVSLFFYSGLLFLRRLSLPNGFFCFSFPSFTSLKPDNHKLQSIKPFYGIKAIDCSFLERCSLITATVCAYQLNNAQKSTVFGIGNGTLIGTSYIRKKIADYSYEYISLRLSNAFGSNISNKM